MAYRSGRHFLQIPGPRPIPERVMRAMDMPVIDHRGPEFGELGERVLDKLKGVFKTEQPVVVFPSSGTGAWEATDVAVAHGGTGASPASAALAWPFSSSISATAT